MCGSFEPIGLNNTTFAGNFNGNYKKISNLYINTNAYTETGLFTNIKENAVIEKVILENVYVNNVHDVTNHDTWAGGISAYNDGIITECGVLSGTITAKKTTVNSVSGTWRGPRIGGIVGGNWGTVSKCFNKANVASYAPTSRDNNEVYAGGVVGGNYKNLEDCYNTGNVTGSGYGAYVGGVSGAAEGTNKGYFRNCYNIGNVSGTGSYARVGGTLRKKWI